MNEYSSDTSKVAEKLAGMTGACANVHDDERNDIKFVPWHGGECPVPAGHDVSIKFMDGDYSRTSRPEVFRWNHNGSDGDIVGYFDHTAEAEQKAGLIDVNTTDESCATWEDVPEDLKWLAENVEECPCAYIKKNIGVYESADMRNQFSSLGHYFTRDQWRRARDLYLQEHDSQQDEFKREHRYWVFKRKHLSNEDDTKVANLFSDILEKNPKVGVDCVVVESDWPNYEATWDSIEAISKDKSQQDEVSEPEQSQEWDGNVNLLVEMIIKCEDMTAAWLESLADAKRKSAEGRKIVEDWLNNSERKAEFDLDNDYEKLGEFYDWLVSTNRLTDGE